MKKITNYLTLTMTVWFASCSQDFIEVNPISTASVDAVYKSDKDFKDAVAGTYAVMRDQYQNFWIFGDLRADDSWHALGNDAFLVSVNTFSMPSSADLMISTWRNYYSAINKANLILQKIEAADQNVVTNMTRHIAEARFLRALAYFDLVRIYGDVPMVMTPITIAEGYQAPRETVDKIYSEVIIPDFLAAEENLPASYSGADVGRATKGAAKSLLAKAYLTIKDFAKAEVKLQEVTTMGYALLPNFLDLYNYSNEHHKEYIFDFEYEEGGIGLGSGFTNKFLPKSQGSAGDIHFGVKGGAGEMNTPTQALLDAFDPADKRRDITVANGYYDEDGVFQKFLQISTFTQKYLTPTLANNDSKANWKVIRYADVLLMYSEALNENGKTDEALGYLNQVRTRAGLPTYAGLSQTDARQKIYDERRFELAMEGHRWFDLVRTGRALDVMTPFGMKPFHQLFPIPLVELQIINDDSILPQNPGYE